MSQSTSGPIPTFTTRTSGESAHKINAPWENLAARSVRFCPPGATAGDLPMISLADVEAAATRIAGRVLRTPAVPSDAVSRATGIDTVLKLDNLQVVGAFKERGAANRLALLSEGERARGVIAMSAGNHAQAVARHASLLGIAATIVMPSYTPATKITRTAAW